MFWPTNTIGRPEISSCSFANAIDRARERDRADQRGEDGRDDRLRGEVTAPTTWNSASATSAAAPPPTPLNRATICGIAVIFTVRAPTTPTTAPIAPPTTIRQPVRDPVERERRRDRDDHPDAADPVPLPRVLRRREEAQREDEADDRDEVEEPDDVRVGDHRFALPSRRAPLEHLEHPVGDEPAADHVRGRQHHRDEADRLRERVVGEAEDDDRTDDRRCRG